MTFDRFVLIALLAGAALYGVAYVHDMTYLEEINP